MKQVLGSFLVLAVSIGAVGCKPKSAAQKIEDKVEDAGHEINQGMERTGERVKDATN